VAALLMRGGANIHLMNKVHMEGELQWKISRRKGRKSERERGKERWGSSFFLPSFISKIFPVVVVALFIYSWFVLQSQFGNNALHLASDNGQDSIIDQLFCGVLASEKPKFANLKNSVRCVGLSLVSQP
jgi:hypothetical protein